MNNKELLKKLSEKINSGEIKNEEVVKLLNHHDSHFSLTKMFYIFGAAIVVIGIGIFISQVWYDIGSFGRISVTLGLGFIFAILGSILLKQKPEDNIGSVFHLIGGLLIPYGAIVTNYELTMNGHWPITIIFAAVFLFYLALDLIHKNAILTFLTIANGTATIYLTFNAIISDAPSLIDNIEDIYQYLTMSVGISYLLFAHYFRDKWNKYLLGALYFFGSLGLLGAAFSQVFDSVLWEILYFFFLFAGLALSVFMKSRNILIISILFFIAHLTYLTNEYFSDSLGWPISLVILGCLFIGLGYASIKINQTYITEKE